MVLRWFSFLLAFAPTPSEWGGCCPRPPHLFLKQTTKAAGARRSSANASTLSTTSQPACLPALHRLGPYNRGAARKHLRSCENASISFAERLRQGAERRRACSSLKLCSSLLHRINHRPAGYLQDRNYSHPRRHGFENLASPRPIRCIVSVRSTAGYLFLIEMPAPLESGTAVPGCLRQGGPTSGGCWWRLSAGSAWTICKRGFSDLRLAGLTGSARRRRRRRCTFLEGGKKQPRPLYPIAASS